MLLMDMEITIELRTPRLWWCKRKTCEWFIHYSGRAIDIGAFTNEQAPIVDVINQFNEKKGVQPAELITGASFPGTTMVDPGGHGDHVHLAYGLGGLVKGITHAMLGEKGKEFVVDNDFTLPLRCFPWII